MKMPHSSRPRRNRVNKIRAKKGLPPLGEIPDMIERKPMPMGVTTIMVPLPTEIRAMLTAARKETQRRDPSTVASDQLYAGAILTAMVAQIHEALFPKVIVDPGQVVLAKGQPTKKLAQTFHG